MGSELIPPLWPVSHVLRPTSLSLGVTLLCYRLGLVVALRLVQVGEEPAELAQLLAGRQALLLQALVILSQVGHLCEQRHFILLLLVVEKQRRRKKVGRLHLCT